MAGSPPAVERRPPGAAYVLAMVLGLVVGVPVVLGPLASHIGTLGDRLASFGVALAVYGVLGLLMGVGWPSAGRRWGLWVALPGVVTFELMFLLSVLAGNTLRALPLLVGYPVVAFAGASLGAWAGSRLGLAARDFVKDR